MRYGFICDKCVEEPDHGVLRLEDMVISASDGENASLCCPHCNTILGWVKLYE